MRVISGKGHQAQGALSRSFKTTGQWFLEPEVQPTARKVLLPAQRWLCGVRKWVSSPASTYFTTRDAESLFHTCYSCLDQAPFCLRLRPMKFPDEEPPSFSALNSLYVLLWTYWSPLSTSNRPPSITVGNGYGNFSVKAFCMVTAIDLQLAIQCDR